MAYTAGQKLRASQLSTYVCTSSTRPDGHSGQIIYETDTGMTAMYTGSAWYYLTPTGEIASDAQYNMSGNMTISNDTNTVIAFSTNTTTTPLVTKGTSGGGHTFTLNRVGRWIISATVRWLSSSDGGERYNSIRCNGSDVASEGILKAASSSPITFNLTKVHRAISTGDVFTVNAYQFSGGDESMEGNAGAGWGVVNLSWLGP